MRAHCTALAQLSCAIRSAAGPAGRATSCRASAQRWAAKHRPRRARSDMGGRHGGATWRTFQWTCVYIYMACVSEHALIFIHLYSWFIMIHYDSCKYNLRVFIYLTPVRIWLFCINDMYNLHQMAYSGGTHLILLEASDTD